MHTNQLIAHFAAGLLFAIAATSPASGAHESKPNVVLQWNQIVQNSTTGPAGPLSGRLYAMVHIAQFDAINSIEHRYSRFHTRTHASRGGSSRAAAAQAARDVLVALVPANTATYDAALATTLADIPAGSAQQGVAVGRTVAERVLSWRANDGASAPPPAFVLPALPGLWQGPTATFTQVSQMKPFALLTTTQFMPLRHPELDSARYATDFEEVKQLGALNSTVRTAEQAQLAKLFAFAITRTTILALWNNVARDVAIRERLSEIEAARLMVLVNVAMQDGLIMTQTGKYVYGLWRPSTAIQHADEDNNGFTTSDPTWTPLINNPPYPTYPGNNACVGASAARALQLATGTDAHQYNVVWQGNVVGGVQQPDVVKSYDGFWQLAVDQADARIYGGIHFRFDNIASQVACPKVAEFVHKYYMRPHD
jgi:hypothetical protein